MRQKKSQNLTLKQNRVYEFIREYISKNFESPTILELKNFLQVSSLRTVTQYLESLERKNLIIRQRNVSRGIKLIESASDLQTVVLPVLSSAGCDNMNVFAEQNFEEFVTLDKDFLRGLNEKRVVVFRAVGDSMVDAGIENGDLVLTEITSEVMDRDKVVAVVDGMALIKQINFSANAVILTPMSKDPQYRPIIMKRDFQVFGKVIEVIKNSFSPRELVYENI